MEWVSRQMHPGPPPRPGNRESERRTKGTVRVGFLAEGDIEFHWDGGRWSLGEKENSPGTREVPELVYWIKLSQSGMSWDDSEGRGSKQS